MQVMKIKKTFQMKLQHVSTVVHFIDDFDNKWAVEFIGTHRDLDGRVFKNGKYISTYRPRGGHANKTIAAHIIKEVIKKAIP